MKIRLIGQIGFFLGVVWAFGGVGEVRAEGLRYLHTDHLGSVIAVSDERGEKVWEGRYLPYGSNVSNSVTSVNQTNTVIRQYTGQEREEEINLYNYNARLYNPRLASFISADKAGGGGNGYAYGQNNPLRFIDPSGNMDTAFDDGGGGGGGSGDFSDDSSWLDRLRQWWQRSKQNEAEYFANCGTPAECYFGVSEEKLETATMLVGGFSGGLTSGYNVSAAKVIKRQTRVLALREKYGLPPIEMIYGKEGNPLGYVAKVLKLAEKNEILVLDKKTGPEFFKGTILEAELTRTVGDWQTTGFHLNVGGRSIVYIPYDIVREAKVAAVSLGHEVTHALQRQMSPGMTKLVREYEAYLATFHLEELQWPSFVNYLAEQIWRSAKK